MASFIFDSWNIVNIMIRQMEESIVEYYNQQLSWIKPKYNEPKYNKLETQNNLNFWYLGITFSTILVGHLCTLRLYVQIIKIWIFVNTYWTEMEIRLLEMKLERLHSIMLLTMVI